MTGNTKPSIDWSAVHPRFKWLARDAGGCVSLFNTWPFADQNSESWTLQGWDAEYGEAGDFASLIPGDCPWHESLVERPSAREFSLPILGQPHSKANSRKLVTRGKGGRAMFIKSEKGLAYEAAASLQIAVQPQLLEGDLSATIHMYYPSRRQDLDESIVLDVMQGKIYKNDRQVKEKHIFWHLDKHNPRAEIVVREIK